MDNDPNQLTRDAWEANAQTWDARVGDGGGEDKAAYSMKALRYMTYFHAKGLALPELSREFRELTRTF